MGAGWCWLPLLSPQPRTSSLVKLPHSLPSWGTYIFPASCAETLDGLPDGGQRLPLGQVEKLEVIVEGREGLQGKRRERQ